MASINSYKKAHLLKAHELSFPKELLYNCYFKHKKLFAHSKKENRQICSKDEFFNWFVEQKRECHYCRIPENILFQFYKFYNFSTQSKFLSIARKNNFIDYTTDNMVLSCMICNTIKSNFFLEDEMISCAEEYITPKWQKIAISTNK
jgi:hypothetical protein